MLRGAFKTNHTSYVGAIGNIEAEGEINVKVIVKATLTRVCLEISELQSGSLYYLLSGLFQYLEEYGYQDARKNNVANLLSFYI